LHISCIRFGLLAGLSFLISCGTHPPQEPPPTQQPPPGNNKPGGGTGSLLGSVHPAGSLSNSGGVVQATAAIPNVEVLIDDKVVATSNEQGYFVVKNVAAGDRVSVCFKAEGFVTRCRNVRVVANEAVPLSRTELMVRGPLQVLPGASGAVTNSASPAAQATIASGAICRADRTTEVQGDISCSITPIQASSPDERRLAPGSYLGRTTGGETVSLVTGGMMDITCTELSSGQKVNVCQGQKVAVQIPIAQGCANELLYPSTIESWGFNETTGLWEQEATYAKTCNGSSGFYAGDATHFSYWNADKVIQTTCMNGRVVTETGRPVPNALIQCEGTDYQGSSESYSGQDGKFCIPLMTGGAYTCTAAKGGFATAAPLSGVAANTAATCGGMDCEQLSSDLVLADPALQITLAWGEFPYDLDSHFIGEGGTPHVYYNSQGSLTSFPFASLDTDDTDSYGPEIVTAMRTLAPGRYRYCVNDYSRETTQPMSNSNAKVEAVVGGVLKEYSVPHTPGHVWRVFEATVSMAGEVTLQDLNSIVETASTGSGAVNDACWQ
jgi:hypothetical protein